MRKSKDQKEKTLMQFPSFAQRAYRKVGRKLVDVGILEDRGKKVARIAELNQVVRRAGLVEDLLGSEVWMKIIVPWMNGEVKLNDDMLVNQQRKYGDDVRGYDHSARIQFVADFTNMLEQTVKLKENAQKEILSLTDKENE